MSAPSRKQIAEAVLSLLKSHSPERVGQMLANYLVANRRTKEVDYIMRELESMRHGQEGISEAIATSAFELSTATKQEIAKRIGDKNVHLTYQVDPEVVGGVRIKGLDWQLDLSIANKLKQLRQLTTKAN
jgi:F-type H+-transporting ATPase subunit delta